MPFLTPVKTFSVGFGKSSTLPASTILSSSRGISEIVTNHVPKAEILFLSCVSSSTTLSGFLASFSASIAIFSSKLVFSPFSPVISIN